MTEQSELSTGTRLGRYVIVRKLGAGGMGAVYLADDPKLSRKVALKLPLVSAQDGPALDRFRREARLAASIEHPHLCPVLDIDEVNGVLFFTMPYVEGTPLSHLIEPTNPWPLRKAAELIRKVGGAVAHLHEHGIIHRDLKPSNVLVRASDEPLLMDLGLAREVLCEDARLTQTGTALGSPAYMAPEQVRGDKETGPAVDIYGLGVMLFELLTGRLPFMGRGPALFAQILNDTPPPPTQSRTHLPAQLDALCLKAMYKDPGQRHRSVGEFLRELDAIVNRHTRTPSDQATEPEHVLKPTVPSAATGPFNAGSQSGESALVSGFTVTDAALHGSNHSPEKKSLDWRRRRKWIVLAVGLGCIGVVVACVLTSKIKSPDEKEKDRFEPARAKAPFDQEEAKKFQQAWASYLNREVEEDLELGNGIKLRLVLLPPGTFKMGVPATDVVALRQVFRGTEGDWIALADQREVTLTQPFYLGKFEVTQEEFFQVMEENPSVCSAGKVPGVDTSTFPVENVKWAKAEDFCLKLCCKLKRTVSLPTEAQWEYACRAGTTTPFHFGNTLNGTEAKCDGTVPYGAVPAGQKPVIPCKVGSYPAYTNAFGLHDMHGNVLEWCADYYGPYNGLPTTDPVRIAPKDKNNQRVWRGGAYEYAAKYCLAVYRSGFDPKGDSRHVGFRVCVSVE